MNQETKSESSPALEVKEDGQIWLIPECPVEPKDHPNFRSGMDQYSEPLETNGFWKKQVSDYQKALTSAERLLVSNQEVAIKAIYSSLNPDNGRPITDGWIKMFKKNAVPRIYPIPGLKWEVDDLHNPEKCSYGYGGGFAADMMAYNGPVAVISLPESEKEKQKRLLIEIIKEDEKNDMYEESQEELWAKVIFDARHYNGTPHDLTALTDHFKKLFTITRRKP